MVFGEESRRAIFEMGHVELIELKKSPIQCPSCLHHVLNGKQQNVDVENCYDPTKT